MLASEKSSRISINCPIKATPNPRGVFAPISLNRLAARSECAVAIDTDGNPVFAKPCRSPHPAFNVTCGDRIILQCPAMTQRSPPMRFDGYRRSVAEDRFNESLAARPNLADRHGGSDRNTASKLPESFMLFVRADVFPLRPHLRGAPSRKPQNRDGVVSRLPRQDGEAQFSRAATVSWTIGNEAIKAEAMDRCRAESFEVASRNEGERGRYCKSPWAPCWVGKK